MGRSVYIELYGPTKTPNHKFQGAIQHLERIIIALHHPDSFQFNGSVVESENLHF